ncbi:FGGY-family carbohydrate kinase [Pedobacter sp. SYP-B3415]|uniref:FGGY-family carbohydrate kinase n=1 Tax=Pedobacter sp. SYP-B3415 TaxID=2496641 RepID=UPI00101B9435|nr:FGGY-family carbohydrate kinase [Pedobacter sp. SYP-B3415]
MTNPYFIGIDIGTQGVRLLAVDAAGVTLGAAEEAFALDDEHRREQDPLIWWSACTRLMGGLLQELDRSGLSGISVTSTSGTVIPLDEAGTPLHAALMYSDPRPVEEAAQCREFSEASGEESFVVFNASCGLPKMCWFMNTHPEKAKHIRYWAHAADFITGRLTGLYGISDYTNVLKSGYDVANMHWPAWISRDLFINKDCLPHVVAPGTVVGMLTDQLSRQFGLQQQVPVAAGMTDGCASQVASGAVQPGQWNTTIGTTLVIKGITRQPVKDEKGRLYAHRHPEGYWMPGGAANIGADWVGSAFAGADLNRLTEAAARLVPTRQYAYPLIQQGERFPFISPQARGFAPEGLDAEMLFAANMEGLAYVERYALELAAMLSGETVTAVYSAGGGSKNPVWLQIRSNVLNLPVHKMKNVSGALGAAILAASKTHFRTLTEAAGAMTAIENTTFPQPGPAAVYEESYHTFIGLLREKGYLQNNITHA